MLIIPSFTLQKGRCISLYKGKDNAQKKTYGGSPVNKALEFQRQGAPKFHCVDWDGSLQEKPVNLKLIGQLCDHLEIPVQVAGGIRSMEHIEMLFELGVSEVVIGVSGRDFIPQAIQKYGTERIFLGIKSRREWVESDSLPEESDEVIEIAEQMVEKGVTRIITTDMERQGALYHPNYDDVDRLILLLGNRAQIFSCGGVVSMEDLKILKSIKTTGVLIGRALLEHKLNLAEAVHLFGS
ncbi:MAG: 1-(5-phosphoribosyl)-5-[(5-phosphoribosylamino)methylideneamino] imidazole-4-carboxamide isomerase [Candidatus Peregrinibacteria bacterium GW2011_GWA2_44_7]|nr:MAG: 1-(5-phosphoribosyl)-5-[(5-phosphoribosylamino)methylideneamino] imidazole-4-carboxamide isomerase [Candidatus Peregrinibacteria bacterium GW2011_GWA2_44_7]